MRMLQKSAKVRQGTAPWMVAVSNVMHNCCVEYRLMDFINFMKVRLRLRAKATAFVSDIRRVKT
jgi:hypothetical protein